MSQKKETFTYAKTILSLMCRYKHPEGKFLIIGGGQERLGRTQNIPGACDMDPRH